MSTTVLSMSMSLDGYIADQGDHLGGDGFDRLYEWFATADGEIGRPSGPVGQLIGVTSKLLHRHTILHESHDMNPGRHRTSATFGISSLAAARRALSPER
jgi:hypothetical protein